MKDKILFTVYIALIILLTSIHSIYIFAFAILNLILISGNKALKILKKTFTSILLFNLIISVSYIIYCFSNSLPWFNYILLINLRVFSLTFLTFLFIEKVNLFKAFSFSKTVSFILILSYSQILSFKKYFDDFKLALKSRIINKPRLKDKYNFISNLFVFFLNKSINNTKEISEAMKSRGFFDD